MQAQTNEPNPIVAQMKPMPRYRQEIVLLRFAPIGEIDAKKAYLAGEIIFLSAKRSPKIFVDYCEQIEIKANRPWKPIIESWKVRNKTNDVHYFTLLRTVDGKF